MNIFKGINISDKKVRLAVYACLAILTVAVYWQVGNFDFINFDDTAYVTENARVQGGLTPDNIRWAFTTTDAEFWHPLTWLSLLIDSQIYGLKAGGFHRTNLLLHILSSLLLFGFVFRMSHSVWRSAFVAAFFALHPVHVESVAWIAERKDTLSAFFFLLTMCSYVYYTEKPGAVRYIATLFFFACGLMSKSMLVTLPVLLILLDFWPLGRLVNRQAGLETPAENCAEDKSKNKKTKLKTPASEKVMADSLTAGKAQTGNHRTILSIPLWQIKEKLPFFALSGLFAVLTMMAQDVANSPTWPLSQRAANALVGFATYVINILFPYHLAVFYPFDAHIPAIKMIAALVFLVAACGAAIFFIRRAPYIFSGWAWFVVMLLPVIGIIPLGKHSIADRYTYLASIGLSFILAWGVPALLKPDILRKKLLPAAGVVYMAVLAALTWVQCSYWENNFVLYAHTLKVTKDNAMVRYNLAHAHLMSGEYAEAKAHLLEAVRINPRHDDYHANLGGIYLREKDYGKALEHFREGLKINDGNSVIHCNLGTALEETGKTVDAVRQYQKAIELNPDYAEAYYRWGRLLVQQGKAAEAADKFGLAVSNDPDHLGAHSFLADILAKQGKIADAMIQYREVLRLSPDNVTALGNLGTYLSMQGRYDEAIDCYRRALNMVPNHPEIIFNIGYVLAQRGDHSTAVEYFKHVLQLKPDFREARQALDKSLAALKRQH